MFRQIVSGSLSLSLLTTAAGLWADEQQDTDQHEHDLEKVVVTASPLETDALEMTQSAAVLADDALKKELANSIGETVNQVLGVQSSSFGPAVGRPVIRGLDGARIDVLENNISSNDASNVSADHAVSIEPFLADQVEVLRGPATLLYGSDTIGGVVNVRTNRIPPEPVDGSRGAFQLQSDSVSDERFGAAKIDFGNERWTAHFDAFYRDTGDYDIPGFAEAEPEEDEEPTGTLENSALQNQGGAAGIAFFGERWQFGVSLSDYASEYGIPGGHGHEEEEGHEDEEGEEEEEELVSIDLDTRRLDLEASLDNPFSGFDRLKVLLSDTDYEHVELEGSEIGTQFFNDTVEGRIELIHAPAGAWRGAFGLQYSDRDFAAIGEEAFVPPTQTENRALFLLEEANFGEWRVEFGLRAEDQDITAANGTRVSHSPFSVSAGAVYHIDDSSHISFNLSRAERAPAEEELLADGPHIATQTFEVGDAGLTEETSNNIELSYKKHFGSVTGTVTLFRNDFDDFIVLTDTGTVEDGLPVRQWTQQDADFEGIEAELGVDIGVFDSGHWQVRAFGDKVNATLADGSAVPRTPPTRIGLGLDWDRNGWLASLDWVHHNAQNDVAPFETPTASYDMVNADVSYRLPVNGRLNWQVFLKARNLGDEEARAHTSFLKDTAPLPGRNWVIGVRGDF